MLRFARNSLAERAARERVIADLGACGVDIARAPSEALSDFVESCAPGPDPALKERGRYCEVAEERVS